MPFAGQATEGIVNNHSKTKNPIQLNRVVIYPPQWMTCIHIGTIVNNMYACTIVLSMQYNAGLKRSQPFCPYNDHRWSSEETPSSRPDAGTLTAPDIFFKSNRWKQDQCGGKPGTGALHE
jgi:hypothetical protein